MKKISFEKGFNGSYIQKSQEIKINNELRLILQKKIPYQEFWKQLI